MMYSNEPNYESYLSSIKEWDETGNTSKCIFMGHDKKDCVKVANCLRNAGYKVTIKPFEDLYQLTVERK